MSKREVKIYKGYFELTQRRAAKKLARKVRKASGQRDISAAVRYTYAESFLENPLRAIFGKRNLKTRVVSAFRHENDPFLKSIQRRSKITEAVAVKGKDYTDAGVVGAVGIAPDGSQAGGVIDIEGVGNKNYIRSSKPTQSDDADTFDHSYNEAAEPPYKVDVHSQKSGFNEGAFRGQNPVPQKPQILLLAAV